MSTNLVAQSQPRKQIDSEWLLQTLRESARPRLIWRDGLEQSITQAVENDEAAAAYHAFIMSQADGIIDLPMLERKLDGKRLLAVSRKGLKRLVYLSFAWKMTRDEKYLNCLEEVLLAVSSFDDWNPSHFLDTAEMSLGVALALDWVGDDLDAGVSQTARRALFELGLETGAQPENRGAFVSSNNWNQVCNAGIVAAALVLAEEHPELATDAINRMIEHLPRVLETYGPDGVYVEGAMYWGYGTQFNVVLFDMLDTALGDRFRLDDAVGFIESADFVHLINAPSGMYYDFYDSKTSGGYMSAQSWFAKETGQVRYLQREEVIGLRDLVLPPSSTSGRLLPVEFIWFLEFQERSSSPLPLNWVGHGDNPIGVFRSSHEDAKALYLAFKGGKATNGHGNMDAGSFILELDGVRWAIDMGNQGYSELEAYFSEHGGNLWSSAQDSARWHLLTKNNFGHSTLTVADSLHIASGMANITSFDGEARTATVDLSEPLGSKVEKAERTFSVIDDRTVEIGDHVVFSGEAQKVAWQLTTQAQVETSPEGTVLRQDGETLRIQVLEPAGAALNVVSLQSPPHPADKQMDGLKRLEVVLPAHAAEAGQAGFRVRLQGGE
ncbi:heparinase II/III family protein [Pelagicoccus sp. SDUM812002]|uniref:heparinase II/III domain-containing protein n=1 Tax=Pelagicoccus sp. SDUM812002 TaxID=3041266 RepID=UPI00280C459F|nr:heparinase II/III family protein [Pelagicoccus sp. SDUM812002]MDQ8186547.1 heparinase II/III family protein [Pelagicoccus sp. SDUM812002]